jgi:hypothetical protein
MRTQGRRTGFNWFRPPCGRSLSQILFIAEMSQCPKSSSPEFDGLLRVPPQLESSIAPIMQKGSTQALDRRAHNCVAKSLPQARQGSGEPQSRRPGVPEPRFNPRHAPKAMQSSMIRKTTNWSLGASNRRDRRIRSLQCQSSCGWDERRTRNGVQSPDGTALKRQPDEQHRVLKVSNLLVDRQMLRASKCVCRHSNVLIGGPFHCDVCPRSRSRPYISRSDIPVMETHDRNPLPCELNCHKAAIFLTHSTKNGRTRPPRKGSLNAAECVTGRFAQCSQRSAGPDDSHRRCGPTGLTAHGHMGAGNLTRVHQRAPEMLAGRSSAPAWRCADVMPVEQNGASGRASHRSRGTSVPPQSVLR